jgi:hypothetical protein
MILFDWKKIKRSCKGNKDIILAISSITWPTPLPSRKVYFANRFYQEQFPGMSYMINPEQLLQERALKNAELVEYITLAARRPLAEYLYSGKTSLDCRLAPFIPTDNQLLTTKNSQIYFAFEGKN